MKHMSVQGWLSAPSQTEEVRRWATPQSTVEATYALRT